MQRARAVSVVCFLWIWILGLSGPVDEGIYLRTKIILWSPVGTWFPTFMFRDVPGTITDCTGTCGFRRNSSSLDRAPGIRLPVLLNSWDNFFVTLPFISCDTWVILLLVYSGNSWISWQANPRGSRLIISCNCCQLFLVP